MTLTIDTGSDAGAWREAMMHPPFVDARIDNDTWAIGITLANRLPGPRLPDCSGAGSETVDSSAAGMAGVRSSHGGPYG